MTIRAAKSKESRHVSDRCVQAFDHALHVAHTWVADVAKAFGTDDRRFAYRVLRDGCTPYVTG